MKTQISKAFRGKEHVGWKKTIGGRSWFLGYGTTAADEARAVELASLLAAKLLLAQSKGQNKLTQADFDDAKAAIERKRAAAVRAPEPPALPVARELQVATTVPIGSPIRSGQGLYAAIDEFVATTRRKLKPDRSNADHIFTRIGNIIRAREAIEDVPLQQLRRKELDDWLLEIRALKNKMNGEPLAVETVRNLVTSVRAAMKKFIGWEWWAPPPLWEDAFKEYTISKLESPNQRKRRRQKRPAFSIDERRILWHLSLPFMKAMIVLGEWAGHTQMEIATMTFDEIEDKNGEMYIDRDRHKTGVHGRWWIPPEGAAVIREVIKTTPRDPAINPNGLAFLTSKHMPLVHRSATGKCQRTDHVGSTWRSILRAAALHNVKHISFKGLRKATAQVVRDLAGSDVSATFLAHAGNEVQDRHYTAMCVEKMEKVLSPKGQEWSQRQVQIIYEHEAYTGVTYNDRTYSGRFFRGDKTLGYVPLDRDEIELVMKKTFTPKLKAEDQWERIDQPYMYDFLPRDIRDLAIVDHAAIWKERVNPTRKKRKINAHPASLYLFSGLLRDTTHKEELKGTLCGREGSTVPYYRHPRSKNGWRKGSMFNGLIRADALHTEAVRILGDLLVNAPDLRDRLTAILLEQRNRTASSNVDVTALEAEAEELRAQITTTMRLLKGAALADAEEELARMGARRNVIEAELRQIKMATAVDQRPVDEVVDQAIAVLREDSGQLLNLPTAPLRDLIRTYVTNATVDMETKRVELTIATPSWALQPRPKSKKQKMNGSKTPEKSLCLEQNTRSPDVYWTHQAWTTIRCEYWTLPGSTTQPPCYKCRRIAA